VGFRLFRVSLPELRMGIEHFAHLARCPGVAPGCRNHPLTEPSPLFGWHELQQVNHGASSTRPVDAGGSRRPPAPRGPAIPNPGRTPREPFPLHPAVLAPPALQRPWRPEGRVPPAPTRRALPPVAPSRHPRAPRAAPPSGFDRNNGGRRASPGPCSVLPFPTCPAYVAHAVSCWALCTTSSASRHSARFPGRQDAG